MPRSIILSSLLAALGTMVAANAAPLFFTLCGPLAQLQESGDLVAHQARRAPQATAGSEARVLRARANQFAQKGQLELAVKELAKVVEIDPNHEPSFYALAYYLKDLGRYAEAAKAYQRATELEPNSRNFLGWFESLREDGDLEAALDVVDQIVERFPGYPRKQRFNLLSRLKRWGPASEDVDRIPPSRQWLTTHWWVLGPVAEPWADGVRVAAKLRSWIEDSDDAVTARWHPQTQGMEAPLKLQFPDAEPKERFCYGVTRAFARDACEVVVRASGPVSRIWSLSPSAALKMLELVKTDEPRQRALMNMHHGWNTLLVELTLDPGQRRCESHIVLSPERSDSIQAMVVPGATWRFLHPIDGEDPAADDPDFHQTFFMPDYDDSRWKEEIDHPGAMGGFGYGDPVGVNIGVPPKGRRYSAYFRHEFDSPLEFEGLELRCQRDDGVIVYLNGEEAGRDNMNADAVDSYTLDTATYGPNGPAETQLHVIPLSGRVVKGRNVLAVSLHNSSPLSSDIRFGEVTLEWRSGHKKRPFTDEENWTFEVDDYLADLDEFERRLLDQSSYLTRRGFDYETALQELRASINENTRSADFVSGLRKLVMQIGDCHASVSANLSRDSGEYLPLRPADTVDGVAAFYINRDEPLDSTCPYIQSIDGISLDQWMAAAAKHVPQGSPQLVHRGSLRWLGRVNLIRDELNLPIRETVTVGLRSADGTRHVEKRLRVTGQGFAVAEVPLQKTRRLNGNIGYLRIATMDERLVESTVGQVKRFRGTEGLIVDVRNNSGGTYAILRAIYGYFMPDGAKPYVTNIAAYRLSHRFSEDHIAYRPTYRADWEGWREEEQAAIRQAAATFQPEWLPPQGQFSEWHYMVLSRERSGRDARDYFFYDKPVVILSNSGSFSATDGFLSAFADLPHAALLGGPSAGGSGATRRFELPRTQVTVALSSMASFRANGKLFDGNGVEVDIQVKPTLEDFTMGTDSVLQRGLAVIKKSGK